MNVKIIAIIISPAFLLIGLELGASAYLWLNERYPRWEWSGSFYGVNNNHQLELNKNHQIKIKDYVNNNLAVDCVIDTNEKGMRVSKPSNTDANSKSY